MAHRDSARDIQRVCCCHSRCHTGSLCLSAEPIHGVGQSRLSQGDKGTSGTISLSVAIAMVRYSLFARNVF